MHLTIYEFVIRRFPLKFVVLWIVNFFSGAQYYSAVIAKGITADCIISFRWFANHLMYKGYALYNFLIEYRTIYALLSCGDDDFCGQLCVERIIPLILDLLNRIRGLKNERKEELVGEAASVVRMILQCCGAVKFDHQANDFTFPLNFHKDPTFEEVHLKIDERNPDLIDHLQKNLANIAQSNNKAKLVAAHEMTSLLRLLVELEQQLLLASPSSSSSPLAPLALIASGDPASPAGSNKLINDGTRVRLSSPSFVAVLAGLLEMERTVIEFRSTITEKRQSFCRIRLILRLLSLLDIGSMDHTTGMGTGLSAAMRKILDLQGYFVNNASSLAARESLTSEDYFALEMEIAAIPLPDKVTSSTDMAIILKDTQTKLANAQVKERSCSD